MKLPIKLANEIINEIDIDYLSRFSNTKNKDHYYNNFDKALNSLFFVEWVIGGLHCHYEDSRGTEIDEDEEPALDVLNKFLDKNYPDMKPYVKDIIDENIITAQWENENDNFGGYIIYSSKGISFEKLCEILVQYEYSKTSPKDYIHINDLAADHGEFVPKMTPEEYQYLPLYLKLDKEVEEKNIVSILKQKI